VKAEPRPFFYPKFVRLLRGYRGADFLNDLSAGLTVGIIALPLAIGFGIASGVTPGQGLWTAIVGGLLISLLGGSRHQIGGPTGAFVPVLAAVTAAHGYNGLALATMMAGAMLVLMGVMRLGALLKYIPFPVVAGFTSGIAVIIFLGQIPEFLGLTLPRAEHAPALFMEIMRHIRETNWQTAVIGALALAIGILWPKVTRKVPASLVAVIAATVLATWLGWPVATIQSKFHGIPSGLPGFHFPPVSLELIRELIAPAFTIAALGGIESLLSATVADGMADTRHDSNQELIGQGIANLCTPLIGGFAVTGAIARTAANIRSGARTPVAGIVHALVLLLFVLVAAKVAALIPLAALSAVLIGVALRMGEWDTFAEMYCASRTDFGVLLAAFALTVVFDLTIGVGGGLLIAAVLFLRRMESVTQVRLLTAENDNEAGGVNAVRGKDVPPGVVLFRFEGPLFFAAAEKLEAALRTHSGKPRIIIMRMRHVPMMDATGMKALEVAWEKMHRDGVTVLVTAIQPQPMKVMLESGLADRIGIDNFCANIDDALNCARRILQPAPISASGLRRSHEE
jgi:SulP family sulfate permease